MLGCGHRQGAMDETRWPTSPENWKVREFQQVWKSQGNSENFWNGKKIPQEKHGCGQFGASDFVNRVLLLYCSLFNYSISLSINPPSSDHFR